MSGTKQVMIPIITSASFLLLITVGSFAQKNFTDTLQKAITTTLTTHGEYTLWDGLPWENNDGIEVPMQTDLDRRILFYPDSTCSEIIFLDTRGGGSRDSCNNQKDHSEVAWLTGTWIAIGDTIHFQNIVKKIYSEREFLDCYYYMMRDKEFICDKTPRCSTSVSGSRRFILRKETLCELGNSQDCYR